VIQRLTARGAERGVLLLSIQPIHVDRIFTGSKLFELRRRLPRAPFDTVYLYQTGNGGIVGGFDVVAIHESAVDQLWDTVGAAGTTKDRFDAYFQGSERGFAIEVRNPFRFVQPISLAELRREFPGFRVPQGSAWLAPSHPLAHLLREHRQHVRAARTNRSVVLRGIRGRERSSYRQLVTDEISRHYDEISSEFADFNLRVHDAGLDPFGFLTESKEVLTACDERQQPIGFTTLTRKRGGAVKSGPTVLFPSHRGMGYGAAVRRAIEDRVRASDGRKLYCTAPDVAPNVVRYLLRSGMRIEAHLARHYTDRHGELVFGKLLGKAGSPVTYVVTRSNKRGKPQDPKNLPERALGKQVTAMFAATWFAPDTDFMLKVIRTAASKRKRRHPKPRTLVCAGDGDECIAAVLLVSKRGGAAKALLLRATNHRETLSALIRAAEDRARELGRRKLYYIHPIDDTLALRLLRKARYVPEGLLLEPYVPGQDAVVLAKFVSVESAAGLPVPVMSL
jgi:predicted transcriptional regulator